MILRDWNGTKRATRFTILLLEPLMPADDRYKTTTIPMAKLTPPTILAIAIPHFRPVHGVHLKLRFAL